MSDDPLSLLDVAATAAVNRKFLIMLVGAGVTTLDDLQDCLMDLAKADRQPGLPDPHFGAMMAAEMEELAKLFDPSVLPHRSPG